MGGGKGSAPAPIYTPPPSAPPAAEDSTLELADEGLTKDEETLKKSAKTQGAKSLQIPLGSVTGTTGSTAVGTGV